MPGMRPGSPCGSRSLGFFRVRRSGEVEAAAPGGTRAA